MFTRLKNFLYRKVNFVQPRAVFEKPDEGAESSESSPSMSEYRKRFEEIESSLMYVAEGLPPEDLPDEETPSVEDYLQRESLKDAAAKALKRLKWHTPDKVPDDLIAENMATIEKIFKRYFESGKAPESGVPIDAVAENDSFYDDFDAQADLEQRLENTASDTVGRVVGLWRGTVRAYVGNKEVKLKRPKFNSAKEMETEISKQLAKVSNKEFRNAPDGSSWLIHDDSGFTFLVSKEGGKFDTIFYHVNEEMAKNKGERVTWAKFRREIEEDAEEMMA